MVLDELDWTETTESRLNPAELSQSHTLIAGINSAVDKLKEGTNENLRVFEYDNGS